MSPFISYKEAMKTQSNRGSCKLLTEANGCVAGCCSGISTYGDTEFNPYPGCHEDQEGFFLLEGEGYVQLDDQVFEVKPGDSFLAAAGVKHTLKTKNSDIPVKVFWFHSAV